MLRHRGVFASMKAIDRSVEKRDPVMKIKEPRPVRFRRGGDLSEVVEVVRSNPNVEVRAAVGSGKSTLCPAMLAKSMGKLVVHTIPFNIAARDIAEYLAKKGDNVVYVDDVESDLPIHGVMICTNAFLVARYAYDKLATLGSAILYLDESHESDVWTAVVRETMPTLGLFSCVIRATATSGPGDALQPELPGARIERKYTSASVKTWSSNDDGQPWSASSINGNTMMCIDRADVRNRLKAEYADHGFDVRVCTSRTDYAYYLETKRKLLDPAGGVVILLVDYAYRSSLTIPGLTKIIDSCEVAVAQTNTGMPTWVYRAAYDFEVQQLLGRGARLPGEKVELWRSATTSPKRMCDLEKVEADAANILYRLFGNRPPIMLRECAFYEGTVPADIAAALHSDHPIALCPPESQVPWVNGDKPLLEEKAKETYQYSLEMQSAPRRRKGVSCHTVPDYERQPSPPPPVPTLYTATYVDPDALDAYSISRSTSPSLVHTIDTEHDNLSIFEDPAYIQANKPKRVAKHILEKRAAEAAALEEAERQKRASTDSSVSLLDLGGASDDAAPPVPPKDMNLERAVSRVRPSALVGAITDARDLRSKATGGGSKRVDGAVIEGGKYLYYHGMDKAPKESMFFLKQMQSIVSYCDIDAQVRTKGLPASERLYAMRILVDEHNHSLAISVATDRIMTEMVKRPPDEWIQLVDHAEANRVLQSMVEQKAASISKMQLCHALFPYFSDYPLDAIPDALDLEQRLMISMMNKFEAAAVKKDPDKMSDYFKTLNSRDVRMVSSSRRRRLID